MYLGYNIVANGDLALIDALLFLHDIKFVFPFKIVKISIKYHQKFSQIGKMPKLKFRLVKIFHADYSSSLGIPRSFAYMCLSKKTFLYKSAVKLKWLKVET